MGSFWWGHGMNREPRPTFTDLVRMETELTANRRGQPCTTSGIGANSDRAQDMSGGISLEGGGGTSRLPASPGSLNPGAAACHLSLSALLWFALAALAAVTVATHVGEARGILSVLRSANWRLLLASLVLIGVFIANMALFYTSTFRASQVPARFGRFILLTSASYFVNLVSKTGGMGGIALYLREARRYGHSAARVSAAYLMVFALGYAAYFVVLVASLVLLYLSGSLTRAEEAASGLIISVILGGAFVIATAVRSQRSLEKLYLLAATPVNVMARLVRRALIVDRASANRVARGLYEAAEHAKRHPTSYALPFLHALGVELLGTAILFVVARSLQAHISAQQALVAYAISLLFSMIAITPSGLGFVEVSLSVLLISFGVPRQNAIAAALAYRLFEFWLPVSLGMASLGALQWLGRRTDGR